MTSLATVGAVAAISGALGFAAGVIVLWLAIGAPLPRDLPEPLFTSASCRALIRACRGRALRLLRGRRG